MTRRPKARNEARPAERGSVRIIGGRLRGRKLEYHGDPRTRPMKDRVREAVFNLLGDVAGTLAIDLFAGTGVLGFEALSRGAGRSFFIEQHFPTADVIRRSAAELGVAEACEVVAADTLVWFRRADRLPDEGSRPWLVFCSPPYDFYVSRRDDLLALIERLWTSAPTASRFVVEADDRFDFSRLIEPTGWRLRAYPPAHVGVGVKAP